MDASGEPAVVGRRWPWTGLSRNVRVLSGVSFLQDAASEMLYPVLPLFIVGVLGAPPAILGLIEGVAEATASVMKAVSGRVSDIRRRKPMVAMGYGVSSVSKLLIGLATGWPLVLVARAADRLGKGLRGPPRDALLADEATSSSRGRVFGFHRAADTLGAVVGPLLGLVLYELLGQRLRPLFFVAFIPAILSVALIAFVHERAPRPTRSGGRTDPRVRLPIGFRRVAAFLTLFGVINFSDTFLILRANELGLGFAGITLVYAAYNLSYALLAFPAGVMSDRLPRRSIYAAGLVIFAVAYLGLGLATSAAWVWVLLPLYGGYTALTDGVSRAWMADLVPKERVGSALGFSSALSGGASLLAGLWAGLAWNLGAGHGRVPLLISGACGASLALVLAMFGARMEGSQKTGVSKE